MRFLTNGSGEKILGNFPHFNSVFQYALGPDGFLTDFFKENSARALI